VLLYAKEYRSLLHVMPGAHTALCAVLFCYCYALVLHSPLTEEIRSFVFITGAIAFILAILLFAVGLAVDVSFVNALTIAIGIFVAFALTGMPMTVSSIYLTFKHSHHSLFICAC
jgi:magnesium-transporting ATPase (P-type)